MTLILRRRFDAPLMDPTRQYLANLWDSVALWAALHELTQFGVPDWMHDAARSLRRGAFIAFHCITLFCTATWALSG